MKVLLFVQAGDGQPKCEGSWRNFTPDNFRVVLRRQDERKERWWLVECEHADAGRLTIAQHGRHIADRGPGRILAPCPLGEKERAT